MKIRLITSNLLLSLQKLDYRWVETASVDVGCHVKVISWNISATRLLVATEDNLELWNYLPKDETPEGWFIKIFIYFLFILSILHLLSIA